MVTTLLRLDVAIVIPISKHGYRRAGWADGFSRSIQTVEPRGIIDGTEKSGYGAIWVQISWVGRCLLT